MHYITGILLTLISIQLSSCFTPSDYENSKDLSPTEDEFKIYWNIVEDEILLAMRVNTLGWIALGIAEPTSGSMPGADIVHGFVNDTGAFVFDRYATEFAEPHLDDCQDWVLVSGEEDGEFTVIEVTRALVNDDPQDRSFQEGNMRIVWAYGDQDDFRYHDGLFTFFSHWQFVELPLSLSGGRVLPKI